MRLVKLAYKIHVYGFLFFCAIHPKYNTRELKNNVATMLYVTIIFSLLVLFKLINFFYSLSAFNLLNYMDSLNLTGYAFGVIVGLPLILLIYGYVYFLKKILPFSLRCRIVLKLKRKRYSNKSPYLVFFFIVLLVFYMYPLNYFFQQHMELLFE